MYFRAIFTTMLQNIDWAIMLKNIKQKLLFVIDDLRLYDVHIKCVLFDSIKRCQTFGLTKEANVTSIGIRLMGPRMYTCAGLRELL